MLMLTIHPAFDSEQCQDNSQTLFNRIESRTYQTRFRMSKVNALRLYGREKIQLDTIEPV